MLSRRSFIKSGLLALTAFTFLGASRPALRLLELPPEEGSGLQKILNNSESLFNIDAKSYDLWKATSINTPIDMDKVLAAMRSAPEPQDPVFIVSRRQYRRIKAMYRRVKWESFIEEYLT